MNTINLNNIARLFVICGDEKNIGVWLDKSSQIGDDGYLVLNAEQLEITEKAFEALDFILDNAGATNRDVKNAIYFSDGDHAAIQSVDDFNTDTGNAIEYAQGLPEDSDEIKAAKMDAILKLREFKLMCIDIYDN